MTLFLFFIYLLLFLFVFLNFFNNDLAHQIQLLIPPLPFFVSFRTQCMFALVR